MGPGKIGVLSNGDCEGSSGAFAFAFAGHVQKHCINYYIRIELQTMTFMSTIPQAKFQVANQHIHYKQILTFNSNTLLISTPPSKTAPTSSFLCQGFTFLNLTKVHVLNSLIISCL